MLNIVLSGNVEPLILLKGLLLRLGIGIAIDWVQVVYACSKQSKFLPQVKKIWSCIGAFSLAQALE